MIGRHADFGYPTSTPGCSRPRGRRVLVNTIGTFRPGDVLTTTPETLDLAEEFVLSTGVSEHLVLDLI